MLLTILGILFILIEIYFPRFGDRLQHVLINLTDYVMQFFTNLFLYKGKSRFGVVLVVVSVIMLSALLISGYKGSHQYSESAMAVFEIGMWIFAVIVFLMIWGAIAPHTFKMFDYITKNKALVGIGVLLVILSRILAI